MQEKADRNVLLDAMRGALIILVVVGHEIQSIYPDYAQNIVFGIIYSFHMPIFMLVSGYTTAYTQQEINFKWLRKRFIALGVPFITWIFVGYVLNCEWERQSIGQKIKAIAYSPDNGGLWFLWVLFLNCCILVIVVTWAKKINVSEWKVLVPITVLIALMIFPIINIGGISIWTGMLGIGACNWHFPFFCLGYLLAKYKRPVTVKIQVCCVLLFIVLSMIYRYGQRPVFIEEIADALPGKFSSIALEYLNRCFNFIVALAGGGTLFFLVSRMWQGLQKPIAYIGRYTLEIYILHMQFKAIFGIDFGWNMLKILVETVVLIGLSIALSWMLEKNRILSIALFGKVRRKR